MAYDAIEITYTSLTGGLRAFNFINENDAKLFFRAAKELIKLLIPLSNYDKVNQFRLDLGALAQVIFSDRAEEISAAMEPNFKAPDIRGSLYPADEAQKLATLKLLEKIEEIDPEPPKMQQVQGSSSSRFFKFWRDNPNFTASLPYVLLPIPLSIGFTYLISVICGTKGIHSVNNFFSSKIRDASSFADGLKTPGAIYGLATLLAVAICVGIYWHDRKKQEDKQAYTAVPRENNCKSS